MTRLIVNPDTDDVAEALAKDASVASVRRTGGPDTNGYFDYVFTSPGGYDAEVRIPSVSLERFHEPMPPRVYIDGSSWIWPIAVEFLSDLDKAAVLEVGERVRELLQGLGTDEERRDSLVVAAVCGHCGEDHSGEQERRGCWTCYCVDRPRETD